MTNIKDSDQTYKGWLVVPHNVDPGGEDRIHYFEYSYSPLDISAYIGVDYRFYLESLDSDFLTLSIL